MIMNWWWRKPKREDAERLKLIWQQYHDEVKRQRGADGFVEYDPVTGMVEFSGYFEPGTIHDRAIAAIDAYFASERAMVAMNGSIVKFRDMGKGG